MFVRATLFGWLLVTAGTLLAAACNGIVGIQDVPPPPATDASSGGSSSGGSTSGGEGASSGSGGSSGGSSSGLPFGDGATSDGASGGSSGAEGGVACPTGLACDVACSGGGTTSVTGKVYDPAGKNPIYNVAVYIPATPLQPLPQGVPMGADACSCSALFKSGALSSTVTGVDGTFTLTNVPVGSNVPLVLQVGKWRRSLQINVSSCQANAQPDKSLTLPGTVAAGSDDSMPDIAVSTGFADMLECLMSRIGVSASEYVAGTSTGGHMHIFAGGEPGGHSGNHAIGWPQTPAFPNAPNSYTDLWASQGQLMPYDITLLSCEGGETWQANPQALEAYLNAGGRVFASHDHYAWFGGPIASGSWYPLLDAGSGYVPPPDWGPNLGTWTQDVGSSENLIGGTLVTTLNGSTNAFPRGQALEQWMANVGALGQSGVPAGELSIYQPQYNVSVASTNVPSQPWISADNNSSMPGAAMYLSFETPVTAAAASDGGVARYCGRAVFSDLHVAGDPSTSDIPPAPGGCTDVDLSPQEKALEFMIFDLSSCVVSDSLARREPP